MFKVYKRPKKFFPFAQFLDKKEKVALSYHTQYKLIKIYSYILKIFKVFT